jgi:hypothetical protein
MYEAFEELEVQCSEEDDRATIEELDVLAPSPEWFELQVLTNLSADELVMRLGLMLKKERELRHMGEAAAFPAHFRAQVADNYRAEQVDTELLYIAMNFLDRYFMQTQGAQPHDMLLLRTVALGLASKATSRRRGLHAKICTEEQKCEAYMLSALEWRLHPVTPCELVQHLAMLCRPESPSGLLNVVSTAQRMLREVAGSALELHHTPSALAVAAAVVSFKTTQEADAGRFIDAVQKLPLASPLNNEQWWASSVTPCVQWMDDRFGLSLRRPSVVPSAGVATQQLKSQKEVFISPTSVVEPIARSCARVAEPLAVSCSRPPLHRVGPMPLGPLKRRSLTGLSVFVGVHSDCFSSKKRRMRSRAVAQFAATHEGLRLSKSMRT